MDVARFGLSLASDRRISGIGKASRFEKAFSGDVEWLRDLRTGSRAGDVVPRPPEDHVKL